MEIPQELCTLAQGCRTAAQGLGDDWTGAQTSLVLDSRDAGNTQGGFDVVAAHESASDAADLAIGRLVAVLEQDVDDVYAAAFSFSTTDEDSATSLESNFPQPPEPSPGPAPSPTPAPTPTS